jgi:dipeptidyl aminopeptidase/acylaminoacyl peptidase
MIKGCCLGFVAVLLSTTPALADPAPISAYAALPTISDPRLSPDGTAVAMVAPVRDSLGLVARKIDGSGTVVFQTGDTAEPEWFHWKTNTRLMAGLRFVAYSANNEYAIHTRLAFLDADGKNATFAKLNKDLPQPGTILLYDHSNRTPQFQDQVISLEPAKPDEILMAVTPLSDWLHPDVMRVNVQTGVAKTVTHEADVTRWLADEKGEVRAAVKVKREHWNGKETHRIVIAREHESDPWQIIDEGDQVQGHRFILVGFAKDRANILYVLADNEGGRLEAREYDLTTHTLGAVLASGPICDAERFGNAQETLGFDAPCARESRHYLDPAWQHDYLAIKNALHADQVWLIDRSEDGKRVLAAERRTASQPPSYWILDRHGEKPNLSPFADSYEGLKPEDIQQTTRVNYPSRDGQVLPGFITLPANHSGPLPFVVLVHSGPSNHDGIWFNWQVQFLVSRGYGVFQPQYRGSSGFGTAFQEAGYQQWGGRMQDDVTDGTRWLISQKLADPARIAIAGSGYGGYSALMGAVKEPALYAAVAAYDPITDLDKLLHRMKAFAYADINRPKVKNEDQDADDISPVAHAAEIKVPVLLVHGKKDVHVPYDHSEDMESALKHAGKQVTAFYPELADAGMNHSAERVLWATELETLLAGTIGAGGVKTAGSGSP